NGVGEAVGGQLTGTIEAARLDDAQALVVLVDGSEVGIAANNEAADERADEKNLTPAGHACLHEKARTGGPGAAGVWGGGGQRGRAGDGRAGGGGFGEGGGKK